MTPDIQELKDKALTAADLANHLNGIDPYTILALIEVAEAANDLVDVLGPQVWKARQDRLRTALEGVKP